MMKTLWRYTKKLVWLLVLAGSIKLLFWIGTQKALQEMKEESQIREHTLQEEQREGLMSGLQKAADQLNAMAPVMLDELTRLDKIEINGTTAINHYTFLLEPVPDIDQQWLEENYQQTVTASTCDDNMIREIIELGASMIRSYAFQDGTQIGQLYVDQEVCLIRDMGNE